MAEVFELRNRSTRDYQALKLVTALHKSWVLSWLPRAQNVSSGYIWKSLREAILTFLCMKKCRVAISGTHSTGVPARHHAGKALASFPRMSLPAHQVHRHIQAYTFPVTPNTLSRFTAGMRPHQLRESFGVSTWWLLPRLGLQDVVVAWISASAPGRDGCKSKGSRFLPRQAQGLEAGSEWVSECLFTPGMPYRWPSKP